MASLCKHNSEVKQKITKLLTQEKNVTGWHWQSTILQQKKLLFWYKVVCTPQINLNIAVYCRTN